MLHLLNLLAAIALLVWGTHIVRTGMLRVRHNSSLVETFGEGQVALAIFHAGSSTEDLNLSRPHREGLFEVFPRRKIRSRTAA